MKDFKSVVKLAFLITYFLLGLSLMEGFGQKSFVNERHLGGFVFLGKAFYNLPEGEPYEPVLLGASYHQPFY